jgi:hypothetical protein
MILGVYWMDKHSDVPSYSNKEQAGILADQIIGD